MISQLSISDAITADGSDRKDKVRRLVDSLLTRANLAFAEHGAAGTKVTRIEVIEDGARCQVTLEAVKGDAAASLEECRRILKEKM